MCVAGRDRPVESNYEHFDVVSQGDESAAEFFNSIKNLSSYDLYVFLGEEYDFTDEDSLSVLVDYIWNYNISEIGAVYTDIQINHDGEYITTKFNPPYRRDLFDERYVLNTPFICRPNCLPDFNTKVQQLYLWDGILWLMRRTLMSHLPRPLFKNDKGLKSSRVQKDIDTINATEY